MGLVADETLQNKRLVNLNIQIETIQHETEKKEFKKMKRASVYCGQL